MSAGPTREQADLAEVLELVLDKGIVINADIAITVGDTEMIGVELRAAIASFETAAEYGLAFPSGTDMRRVEQASGRPSLEGEDADQLEGEVDLGIGASSGGAGDGQTGEVRTPPGIRPNPTAMLADEDDDADADANGDEDTGDEARDGQAEGESSEGESDDVTSEDGAEGGA